MDMIIINVLYTITDGKRDEFYRLLCDMGIGEKSRNENGNIKYDYYFSAENPDGILLLEAWTNQEVLDAHAKSAHFLELQAVKKDYVTDVTIDKYTAEKII